MISGEQTVYQHRRDQIRAITQYRASESDSDTVHQSISESVRKGRTSNLSLLRSSSCRADSTITRRYLISKTHERNKQTTR